MTMRPAEEISKPFQEHTILPTFDFEPRQIVWLTGQDQKAQRALMFQFMKEALECGKRVFYIPRNALELTEDEYRIMNGFSRKNFTFVNLRNDLELTVDHFPLILIQNLVGVNPTGEDVVCLDQFTAFNQDSDAANIATEMRTLIFDEDVTLVLGSIVPELYLHTDITESKTLTMARFSDHVLTAVNLTDGRIFVGLMKSRSHTRSQGKYEIVS